MKILLIQEESDSRDRLAKFLEAGGAEVTAIPPVWPGFFHEAKEKRPDVALVDCSPDPGYGREVAGYLGETGFTNQIKVLAFNVVPDEEERFKRRAPKATVVTLNNLGKALQAVDPEFEATW